LRTLNQRDAVVITNGGYQESRRQKTIELERLKQEKALLKAQPAILETLTQVLGLTLWKASAYRAAEIATKNDQLQRFEKLTWAQKNLSTKKYLFTLLSFNGVAEFLEFGELEWSVFRLLSRSWVKHSQDIQTKNIFYPYLTAHLTTEKKNNRRKAER